MKRFQIIKAAEKLYRSRIDLNKINELPQDSVPENTIDAYSIQNQLSKMYLLANQQTTIIGKKIGCTNEVAQKQINVSEPFFGNIFSDNVSKSNSIIEATKYFQPYVEPEFSFKLCKELNVSQAPYSVDEIYDSIESVLPSIEIVDSRFNDWTTIGINNLIADNAAHAHWIYGEEKKDLSVYDFNNHEVVIYINGKIIEKGNSKNVLKNPINSLTWLINNLSLQSNKLSKNSFISTGTCTAAIPINKNDKICADFGKLGKVNFSFV